MEEPVINEPPQPTGQETLSFMDKVAGMFYEPTRIFESFRTTGVKFADWFVPTLILALLVDVSVYVRFSSPDLRFQMAQQQEQRFDKMVSQGKMTAEQAQQATQRMEEGSSTFMAIGMFSAFMATFIFFFVLTAVWLLIGKFALKGDMNYTLALGVSGLSNWIGVVGIIAGIVVTIMTSRLDGGFHLGMFSPMNVEDKLYSILSQINLFTIWSLAVVAIGIGTLSNKKWVVSGLWVSGIWVVWILVSVFVLGGMFR